MTALQETTQTATAVDLADRSRPIHLVGLQTLGAADLVDGTFVVAPASPKVYYITGGKRRWVTDPTTYLALAPTGWASLVAVSDADMATLPEGTTIPSREDGRVYTGSGAPEVYVIESLARHHIPDQETLIASFGGWAAVVVIDLADCNAIPVGAAIPSVKSADSIDSYLRSLPDLHVDPVVDRHDPAGSGTYVLPSTGMTYDVQNEHATLQTQQSNPWLLSPALDVLYPGSLIQGASLASGQLAPVAGGLKRSGGTITVATDVQNPTVPTTMNQDVTEVSEPIVNDARVHLIYAIDPHGGAIDADCVSHQARTVEHGLVKLGVSLSSGAFNGDLKASLETNLTRTCAMVMFRQIFYSVVFTPPSGANPFFDPAVTVDQVRAVSSPANPPCYLSQVDYGRMFIATISGTDSYDDLSVALKLALKTVSVSGQVDLDAKHTSILQESTVSVMELGGGTNQYKLNALLNPFAELPNVINQDGNFTANNPGVPLRYIARHAGSRNIVTINQTTDFNEAVAFSSRNVAQTFSIWDGPGGGPVRTGIQVGNGDHFSISASGKNKSGVLFTGEYGPDGWTTWAKPGDGGHGYPLPNDHPFALCAAWDSSAANNGTWFYVGTGTDAVPSFHQQSSRVLYLGTNDNNPLNGDPKYKFTVNVTVNRTMNGLPPTGRAVA